MKILYYGVNGYTGQLILEEAKRRGLLPIIAGRDRAKIEPLAKKYGLSYRVFSLDNPKEIDYAIADIEVVLHCAGPFKFTTEPMVQACIRNMVHYLDISGRVEGFEYAATLDAQAKKMGVMLLPGVGFDVVPSDCLVAHLKRVLPDASTLSLAVAMKNGGVSHGTAISAVENLGQKGVIRQNGKIIEVPMAHKERTINFGGMYQSTAVTVPWGDVSTAYYTADIPNIEVFMATSSMNASVMQFTNKVSFLLKSEWVKDLARKIIDNRPAGPSERQRKKSVSFFWGEVSNNKGEKRTAVLKTPEAYTLTAILAVDISEKVLRGRVEDGFQTPAKLLGPDYILSIAGVERKEL